MKRKKMLWLLLVLMTLSAGSLVYAGPLRAYYTKIASGQAFERYSRTGPYADIVVELEKGKFVFWRGSSYLPYWETSQGKWFVSELFKRKGDGPGTRPDKVNTFSRVIIAESTPEHVLICWRYLPQLKGKNPHVGVDATHFVEECFDVKSNGTVTRTVKQGTPRIDAWQDALNKVEQIFTLTRTGLKYSRTRTPVASSPPARARGNAIQSGTVVAPKRAWRFDEAEADVTSEKVTGTPCVIMGHKSLWKPGISGTALQFDGYTSCVTLPANKAPKLATALTLEAWVAIGAYPWNWTPIVQQCDEVPEEMQAMRGDRALLIGEEGEEEDEEADEDDEAGDLRPMEFDDLPEPVRKMARREYPHAPLWGVEVEGHGAQTYYHVMFEVEGSEAGLKMTTKGHILDRWHFEEGEDDEEDEEEFTFVLKKEDDVGYFLGIDGLGHPGLKIRIGDTWEELVSERVLERRQWYHMAGTYAKETGVMSLYIDGKLAAQKTVAQANIVLSHKMIKIGKGKPRRPIRPVRANTFMDAYSFDGLIDEVRIYDVALDDGQVRQSYNRFKPAYSILENPAMDARVLPAGKNTGEFGAYYAHLKFYETWDNMWRFGDYPDVVVEFDQSPARFVFWRGVGYIPMLVNEKGHWYSNEFNETWNKSGGQGCQEPMSDKESYTNHARIIENTPARVVVHWRYPLIDVHHVIANYNDETGWGDWSDWYYTIYPDGVAVKKMHLWTDGERNHEWQEGMAILGPDQHPEQVLETEPALLLADLAGRVDSYNWINGPPDDVDYENKKIHVVNYRADYDPFTIADFEGGNVYGGEVTDYAVFPSWNHWPVGQMPSDGRYASFPDRTSHCSLTHVWWPAYREASGDRPFYQKLMLEGMSKQSPAKLVPLAKSWFNPAAIQNLAGAADAKYDRAQRAYVFAASNAKISFRLAASSKSPVVNPCFVIKAWNNRKDARVTINGKKQRSGPGLRQGTTLDTDGSLMKIIWLQITEDEPIEVEIRKG